MRIALINVLKGFIIGISVLVPGLSGGTTAILLDVYEPIINSVSDFFKNTKKNFKFLTCIMMGGALGIFTSAIPIKYVLENYSNQFLYLVIGIISGSLPIFVKSIKKNLTINLIFIIIGFMITDLIEKLPINNLNDFTLIILSILMATALILPGISITNILIAFGIYESVIFSIRNFELIFLGKLLIYILISALALTKLLNYSYKKYPIKINMLICGMIIASIKQVTNEITAEINSAVKVILIIFGFLFSFCIVLINKRTDHT